MSVFIIIKYRVTGTDHSGYCSDAEGSPIDPEIIYEEKYISSDVPVDKHGFLTQTNMLNYYNNGCRTDGSGYCTGCQQYYNAIWARVVDEHSSFYIKYNESINARKICEEEKHKIQQAYIRQRELSNIEHKKKIYDLVNNSGSRYDINVLIAQKTISENELGRDFSIDIESTVNKYTICYTPERDQYIKESEKLFRDQNEEAYEPVAYRYRKRQRRE